MDKVDEFGCLGSTIKVGAGHYVDLANPDPETIDLRSIAGALSRICRFGGHCPEFYSVAEHCVHVAQLAMDAGCSREVSAAALLHDASEAYCGDVVNPLKNLLPEYQEIERRIESAICKRFGISERHHGVKDFDRRMLKAEKIYFWPDDREKWEGFAGVEAPDISFSCWPPIFAETNFLHYAEHLGIE